MKSASCRVTRHILDRLKDPLFWKDECRWVTRCYKSTGWYHKMILIHIYYACIHVFIDFFILIYVFLLFHCLYWSIDARSVFILAESYIHIYYIFISSFIKFKSQCSFRKGFRENGASFLGEQLMGVNDANKGPGFGIRSLSSTAWGWKNRCTSTNSGMPPHRHATGPFFHR